MQTTKTKQNALLGVVSVHRLKSAVLLACMTIWFGSMPIQAQEKPNFLIILADDMSWHDVGANGNKDVMTPNLDTLAEQGMSFNRLYAQAPMCAPLRMSLYTGIGPVRNGGYPNHSSTYSDVKSMPHYLNELGYRTAFIGKTHFKPAENFPFEFLDADRDNKDKTVKLNRVETFIKEQHKKPWALVVATWSPHGPWSEGDPSLYNAKKLALPPYFVDTPETREAMTRYYAEIKDVDNHVGKILAWLNATNQNDNTVVLFLSEQGSSFPLAKWTNYEAGVRAAGFLRYPPRVTAGIKTDAIVQYIDVLPTVIELAGGDPNNSQSEGKSFVPLLDGKVQHHNDYAFAVQTSTGIINAPESGYASRTVRSKNWRLIWNLQNETQFSNAFMVGRDQPIWQSWLRAAENDSAANNLVQAFLNRPEWELYHYKNSPYEFGPGASGNLADDPAYQAEKVHLQAILQAWMNQQADYGIATEKAAPSRRHANKLDPSENLSPFGLENPRRIDFPQMNEQNPFEGSSEKTPSGSDNRNKNVSETSGETGAGWTNLCLLSALLLMVLTRVFVVMGISCLSCRGQ